MISVNSFSIQRLNNAEFVAFTMQLNALIESTGSEKLGFDSTTMMSFASLLKKLNDQVRYAASSAYTQQMNDFNSRRVQVFKRIYYRLKIVEASEQNQDLLDIKNLVETQLLKVYPLSVTRLPFQEFTTVLAGFILDLKQKLDEDAIDVLGIMSDVTALEMANNAFIQAYNERSTERAANSGRTAELRQQMNELYLSMCYQLNYIVNSSLEANKTKAEACVPFIQVLNAVLADTKRRYNQRMNALHGATGEDDNDDNEDIHGGGDKPSDSGSGSGSTSGNSSSNNSTTGTGTGTNTGNPGDPIDNGSSVIF